MTPPCFLGIDVAKAHLDSAVRPSGEHWRSNNEATAIATLVQQVQALAPRLVVLEATGGYERPTADGSRAARHAGSYAGWTVSHPPLPPLP